MEAAGFAAVSFLAAGVAEDDSEDDPDPDEEESDDVGDEGVARESVR
ncbi:MAG: hypothetical protein JWP19_1996 [Rhodoglobus sp.]|nr:hypothetical protein [Rhodoglobus sp.]